MIFDNPKNIYCRACDCIIYEVDMTTKFYWSPDEQIWKVDIMIVCPECEERKYVFVPISDFVTDE